MSEYIHAEREGNIFAISIQRSDKKNSLTTPMYGALTQLLAQADQDDQVSVIHLTGSGTSFCAGNDLTDFIASAERGDTDSPGRVFLQQLHAQRKPVVAAVNGVAVGIGVTLLLHCDLVYAAAGAPFRMPFVDLGLVPEGGSSALIPQLVGHRRAAELLLMGELFNAETAEQLGIINKVCPADELHALSWSAAQALAAKPQQALLDTKAMLRRNPSRPVQEVIDTEIAQFMGHLATDETQSILRGFVKPSA